MERTYKHFPEITHGKGIEALDVVRQNVGLRPSREGGPRVENEFWSEYTLIIVLEFILTKDQRLS